eukprot:1158193-Pelagomonas_calceolata.AAC.4
MPAWRNSDYRARHAKGMTSTYISYYNIARLWCACLLLLRVETTARSAPKPCLCQVAAQTA